MISRLLSLLLCATVLAHVSVYAHNDDDDYYYEEDEPSNVDCNLSSALDFEECTAENLWARSIIPHIVDDVPLARPLPRISVEELRLPENEGYRTRTKPFILTGAMEGWGAMNNWPFDTEKPASEQYLTQLHPRAVCDFYPYNMLKRGSSPYLIRWSSGLEEVLHPTRKFPLKPQLMEYACVEGCRYLHMQLTPKMWQHFEEVGDLPKDRHVHTKGDKWWMDRCMTPDVQEEFNLKTHWKIVLVGSLGAGMFNHTDSLQSASWHGHVQGKKWWYVCGRNGETGQDECFESVLSPGEVLYYGANWWHHTRNLDAATMTVTGTTVTRANFQGLGSRLHGECAREVMGFDFSGKLCDALDQCLRIWHDTFAPNKKMSKHKWKPWRKIASDKLIKERDARKPEENNYDGRNYISE